MADYASAIPVKTLTAGDVNVKVVDTAGSNQLAIDASGKLSVVTVDAVTSITNNVNIADGGNSITVDAINLDIRDLTSVSDSVEVKQATAANLNATVVQATAANLNATIVQATAANLNATVVASNLDIRDLAYASDSVTAKQASGDVFEVHISETGSGDEVFDYESNTIAAAGNATQTYTVTSGKVLYLRQIGVSGSGKFKAEIKSGVAAAETTKFVIFGTAANDTKFWDLPIALPVAATNNVLIVKTNMDNQSQDIHGVIVGLEQTA